MLEVQSGVTGETMALLVSESTLDDLLRSSFQAVLTQGAPIQPTRGEATEVIGACLELTNPRARLSRTESRRRAVSAVAELCWYLSGTNEVQPIAFYISKYEDEAEQDGSVYGGYGPRLFGSGSGARFTAVLDLLRTNPESRRAVVQIFDHQDIAGDRRRDVPCTCTLQFLLRDGQLNLIVSMRSNDVYLGLPHDVFAFTMLQELAARSLDAELGRYVHTVGSLHLYTPDRTRVDEFLSEGWQSTVDPMPPMPSGDPWPSVEKLLQAEEQIRQGVQFSDVQLPDQVYWADLARILGANVARRNGEVEKAREILDQITHHSFREFA